MAAVAPTGRPSARAAPGPRFHRLAVRAVVPETAEARSFVLDVPDDLAPTFSYRAGQFCTFRVSVGGRAHLRCYSMSSSPEAGDPLTVTVKRVPGGAVSNWMIDQLAPGDEVDVTPPAGVFCLDEPPGSGDDVVAFAGGSGITPVFSVIKTALASGRRRVRLFYANRGPAAVIFDRPLDRLAAAQPERLEVLHHLDDECGLVSAGEVADFVGPAAAAEYFVCGPQPFMDIVTAVLGDRAVPPGRLRLERFDPLPGGTPTGDDRPGGDGVGVEVGVEVVIRLGRRREVATHRPGTTILQTARQVGLAPPYSCEAGNCATCMARLVRGTATMHANNALTDEEVADGWVLTCQAVPTSPLEVVYDDAG
jgi:3-ketosteroid 9alpha-monooxygenase subunit B